MHKVFHKTRINLIVKFVKIESKSRLTSLFLILFFVVVQIAHKISFVSMLFVQIRDQGHAW